VGVFKDRQAVEANLQNYAVTFLTTYERLCGNKCPTLHSRLPFLKQGILATVAYGRDAFLILSRNSRQPPGKSSMATWDESEYPQLSIAEDVDSIAEIVELEEILYSKKLESLEPKYLDVALGIKEAEEEAEELLEQNMRMIHPTPEDAVDRMKQAYELLFRLENSFRQLIEKKLKMEFGEEDWWEKGTTHHAKENSVRHQKDARWKWHEPIKASPLNYVDFECLHDIIVNKNWEIFKDILGPLPTFSANVKNLEMPRIVIAHSNTLSQQEFYDFRRNVERLLRVVKAYLQ